MPERKLKLLLFVRNQFVKGACEKCNAIFTAPLADDLKSSEAEMKTDFEKHECQP